MSVFEHLAADDSDKRLAHRRATAVAQKRVQDNYGAFLAVANTREELSARLSVVRDDIRKVVADVCNELGGDPEVIGTSILANFSYGDVDADVSTVRTASSGEEEIRVVSRRTKMCPYHREVTDISLAAGDPAAGFNAMARHAWGDRHCQGAFEGGCNFRPAMTTQKFWDDRAQKQQEKREQLEQQQQIDQQVDQTEIPDSPEGINETPAVEPVSDEPTFTLVDDGGDHSPEETAVGSLEAERGSLEPMAASRTAAKTCPRCGSTDFNEEDNECNEPGCDYPLPQDDSQNAKAAGTKKRALLPPLEPSVLPQQQTVQYGQPQFPTSPSGETLPNAPLVQNQTTVPGIGPANNFGLTPTAPPSGGQVPATNVPGTPSPQNTPAQVPHPSAPPSPSELSATDIRQRMQQHPNWDPNQHPYQVQHYEGDLLKNPKGPGVASSVTGGELPLGPPGDETLADAALRNDDNRQPETFDTPNVEALDRLADEVADRDPALAKRILEALYPNQPQPEEYPPAEGYGDEPEHPIDIAEQRLTGRTAEALETVDIEKDTHPDLDKTKWKPNALYPKGNLPPIDAEMSGSPNPTKQVDILEPVATTRSDDFLEGTRSVTESQDVDQASSFDGDKADSGSWAGNNGANPVTSSLQSNAIRDLMAQGFIPENQIQAAIKENADA